MVNYKDSLKTQLTFSIQLLNDLKQLFLSLEIKENIRINASLNDIENTLKNCRVYLQDENLLDVNIFRFDMALVKLVDNIQYNDYGIIWDTESSKQKSKLCNKILELVSELNAITLAEKSKNNTQ